MNDAGNEVTYARLEPRRDEDVDVELEVSTVSWLDTVIFLGGLAYNASCLAFRTDADVVGNVTWSVVFGALLTFALVNDARHLRAVGRARRRRGDL